MRSLSQRRRRQLNGDLVVLVTFYRKKTMTGIHICVCTCKNCIYAIFLACIYAYAMQYAFVFEYAICNAYAFNMNMQYANFAYCIFGYKQLVRSCLMCCRNSKRLSRIVTESELMIKVNGNILME